jgi:multidrug efflux pump subunit AcrB
VFAWFVRNPVAANILVSIVIIGGLITLRGTTQEVFPEVDLDIIVVNAPYPGASPDEVEKGVTLVAEESVRGIDGIKKVTSTSLEGFMAMTITLELGANPDEVLNQVRAAIDRITTFPENVEKPTIFLATNRFRVIEMVLYGDLPETTLKALAEQARSDLLLDPGITVVEITNARAPEISVEVSQATLRQYGTTLDAIAATIRASSIELPAGRIKTDSGEVLLRTAERRDTGADLADIPVVAQPDGSAVKLGEIANIVDGFADTDQTVYWNGKRAISLEVFRVGDQKPIEVAEKVKAYVAKLKRENRLPPGVGVATWFDASELYEGRMNLLIDNALQGLVLVLIMLGLFLELKLALWVTVGIPTSFLGAALFLPPADVTINMISLFAFILALGSVVDDAINIGESVHRYRQDGHSRVRAAILGVKEVAKPVTFAIVVIMIAYVPMLFVPGVSGKFFRQIPIVVIGVLAISLAESLFVLPAHLAHSKPSKNRGLQWIDRQQGRLARGLEWAIAKGYVPLIRGAVRHRYITLPIALAILLATCGLVQGGHVKTTPFPQIESDVVSFTAHLPFGAPVDRTHALEDELVRTAREILDKHGGEPKLSRGIFSTVGVSETNQGGVALGGHISQVWVYLVPLGERSLRADTLAREWREKMKDYPGIETSQVDYTTGFSAGKAVAIQLNHPDARVLEQAAKSLAAELRTFAGAKDVDDGYTEGKPQLDLRLRPEARAAGVTAFDLARTVRSAFFGAEALRLQRGRDEVRVYVRLPEAERRSEHGFEEMIVRTPSGAEMPISAVADVARGQSYTEIKRIDGRRSVEVTADVDNAQGNAREIMDRLLEDVVPRLQRDYPGLDYRIGGEELEFAENMKSLFIGMGIAIIAMYALLAIAFRSYVQPFAILFAIPFGMVGAVVGHVIMGYSLSLMSMMGIIALAGVAINDSLVYVDAINRFRDLGVHPMRAAVDAGAIRARPIILTATTAFFGLAPLIFETDMQARFLIPMAISLGFGIILSTLVTLIVVPCFYLLLSYDLRRFFRWWLLPIFKRRGTPVA